MLLLPSIAIGKSKENDTTSIEMESDSSTGESSSDASKPRAEVEPKTVKEIIEKRTFNTKHFLMDDGTMKAEIHQGNLHYQDEANNWEEINTALVDEADIDVTAMKVSKDIAREAKEITSNNKAKAKKGIDRSQTNFRSVKVPFDTLIPKDYSKGYSIAKGTDKLTFKPINANKSIGTIDMKEKNRIHYKNVWKHTNVDLIVTNGGVKEFIYLLNENAPKKFSFEVNTKLKDDLRLGELLIEPLWMEDDKGTIKYIQPTIAVEGKKNVLHIEVDTTGMSYPITVDPSVWVYTYSAGVGGVSSSSPDMLFPTILRVGERTMGSKKDMYLSYFKFPLHRIPENAQITSVVLAAKMSSYYLMSGDYLDVIPYEVTENWNAQNLTFNNRPSHLTNSSGSLQRITSNLNSTPSEFVYWDVTTMTKSNFENNSILHADKAVSMVLYPVGSGGNGYLKEVNFDVTRQISHQLIVNYKTSSVNSPPTVSFNGTNTVMYLDKKTKICWVYNDSNGDKQVKYRISGKSYDGLRAYHSGERYMSISSGTSYCHYFDETLPNVMWQFKISVFDGIDWSSEAVSGDMVSDHVDAPNTNSNVPMSGLNKVYYGGFENGGFGTGDKVDFFKFTAFSTGEYQFLLKNIPSISNKTEIDVSIFDENKQVVVPLSNIVHGKNLEIVFNTLEGKVYYVRISNVTNNYGGPYKWVVIPTFRNDKNEYTYIYDSLGRLQFITYNWAFNYMRTEYVYDLNGNIIKRISTQSERK